jgi:methylglyoxal/glyoxal reductase
MYRSDLGGPASNAVKYAVSKADYIMIDTAQIYQNEADVGVGLKESKVHRENIFIVSKLFTTENGGEGCLDVFKKSLNNLGVDYIDQYLLHAPQGGKVLECYDALLELQKQGILKTVGVSNFGVQHLEVIKNSSRPLPAVNQIELHPWCTNEDIVKYCQRNNIAVVGYSPLAKGEKLSDPYVLGLAKKYNKTSAQILIRWSLEKGFITIPKSQHEERIMENSNVFDFELTLEEIEKFDSFGRREKIITGWDPTINPMDKFGPIN